jgi:hypothetical protein
MWAGADLVFLRARLMTVIGALAGVKCFAHTRLAPRVRASTRARSSRSSRTAAVSTQTGVRIQMV